MPHAFFDHTGDVGVRLVATTLDGLFEAAAEALADTICSQAAVRPVQDDDVRLEASRIDLLLVDWLNELLYLFEVRQLLVARARVTVTAGADGYRLTARVAGEPLDPDTHGFKLLVKAVTYHGLHVARTPEGWEATVVFDI